MAQPTPDGARPARRRARAAGCLRGLVLFAVAVAVAAPPARALTVTRGPLIQNPDALTRTMTITKWTYANGLGGIQGIVRVTVRASSSVPGQVDFSVTGRNGSTPSRARTSP